MSWMTKKLENATKRMQLKREQGVRTQTYYFGRDRRRLFIGDFKEQFNN